MEVRSSRGRGVWPIFRSMPSSSPKSSLPVGTVAFFMTDIEHAYVSSTMVREIASLGGDVSSMVPQAVIRRLRP